MALITEIIKKYETEGRKRVTEARNSRPNSHNATIVSEVPNGSVWEAGPLDNTVELGSQQPALDTTAKDLTATDIAHFDWHNKMVEFHDTVKKAVYILNEMENSSQVLKELERLRSENLELKERIKELEH
jgi:hypothetical protein